MILSLADLPSHSADAFGGGVDAIGKLDPRREALSTEMIADLVSQVVDSVQKTHAFLDKILQFDWDWRTSVFRGETEYDEATEHRIEDGLRFWIDAAERFLSQLDKMRPYGVYAESQETLRPRIVEVRGMLTPDDEFFQGEELDDLTARAIAEHEAGHTVEFRVMGE